MVCDFPRLCSDEVCSSNLPHCTASVLLLNRVVLNTPVSCLQVGKEERRKRPRPVPSRPKPMGQTGQTCPCPRPLCTPSLAQRWTIIPMSTTKEEGMFTHAVCTTQNAIIQTKCSVCIFFIFPMCDVRAWLYNISQMYCYYNTNTCKILKHLKQLQKCYSIKYARQRLKSPKY